MRAGVASVILVFILNLTSVSGWSCQVTEGQAEKTSLSKSEVEHLRESLVLIKQVPVPLELEMRCEEVHEKFRKDLNKFVEVGFGRVEMQYQNGWFFSSSRRFLRHFEASGGKVVDLPIEEEFFEYEVFDLDEELSKQGMKSVPAHVRTDDWNWVVYRGLRQSFPSGSEVRFSRELLDQRAHPNVEMELVVIRQPKIWDELRNLFDRKFIVDSIENELKGSPELTKVRLLGRDCIKILSSNEDKRNELIVCPSLDYAILSRKYETRTGRSVRTNFEVNQIGDDKKTIQFDRSFDIEPPNGSDRSLIHYTLTDISRTVKDRKSLVSRIADGTPILVQGSQQIKYVWDNGKIRKSIEHSTLDRLREVRPKR